jgi:hypothetical protein
MCERSLVDKTLTSWLDERDKTLFPHGTDYGVRYKGVAKYLSENVHTEIEKGAILAQIGKGRIEYDRIVYLNNHGPGHVDKVIGQASEMLKKSGSQLTPYEGYILLSAIQFHDVGNICGRKDHEKKCRSIMNDLGTLLGDDRPEKTAIAKIAAAHGGCIDGDPDTIGKLQPEIPLFDQSVRKQYLAAVLRFADELADDRSRASRFLLKTRRIPSESEIYHAYSHALYTVLVGSDEIQLRFDIDRATALRKFDKGRRKVFLLDEIYERTLKMHRERIYCMRFLRPHGVGITRIGVKIEVCEMETDALSDVIKTIPYSLEESGYPADPHTSIYTVCPDLEGKDGQWLKSELK